MSAPKNILLLKAGDVRPPLLATHGDYDRWFARALAGACRLTLVQAHRGQALPPVDGFDAVLMTGSPLSAVDIAPWMERAAQYMVDAAEHRRPVLGVCFGHQLLGYAFGVPVARHPQGREVGTVEVRLTPEGRADPLFRGLPETLAVQATHEDIVPELPRGAQRLAGNAHTAIQAMAVGSRIRGVQFHPEMDAATMSALLAARRQPGSVGPAPFAERILHNFVRAL